MTQSNVPDDTTPDPDRRAAHMWVLAMVVIGIATAIAVWLIADLANPCAGQFTDLLGCLTSELGSG